MKLVVKQFGILQWLACRKDIPAPSWGLSSMQNNTKKSNILNMIDIQHGLGQHNNNVGTSGGIKIGLSCVRISCDKISRFSVICVKYLEIMD